MPMLIYILLFLAASAVFTLFLIPILGWRFRTRTDPPSPDLVPREVPSWEPLPPVSVPLKSAATLPSPPDPKGRYEEIWKIARLLMPPSATCLMEVIDQPGASTLRCDYEHACGYRLIETRTVLTDVVIHRLALTTGGLAGGWHEAELRVACDASSIAVLEDQMAQLRGLAGAICTRSESNEWKWRPFSRPKTRICA